MCVRACVRVCAFVSVLRAGVGDSVWGEGGERLPLVVRSLVEVLVSRQWELVRNC